MLMEAKLNNSYEVDSAGTQPDGDAANQEAKKVIKNMYGGDLLENHIPKQLSSELVDRAYLVVVMEDKYASGIPQDKVQVLGISDPWNQGYEAYQSCAHRLKLKFQEVWPIITAGIPATEELPDQMSGSGTAAMAKLIAEKEKYGRGLRHVEAVKCASLAIFDKLLQLNIIYPEFVHQKSLLEAACYLHDVGVGKEEHNEEHNVAGFRWFIKKTCEHDKREVEYFSNRVSWILAYCILWHRGHDYGLREEFEMEYCVDSFLEAKYLAAILRIGDALSWPSGRPVKRIKVIYNNDILTIESCPQKEKDDLKSQFRQADEKKDLFVSATKILGLKNIEDVRFRRCSHPGC
jgi:protein-tyrosine-phosphatase